MLSPLFLAGRLVLLLHLINNIKRPIMFKNISKSVLFVQFVFVLLGFTFVSTGSIAQDLASTKIESSEVNTEKEEDKNVIQKAMEDELQRSMKELAYENFEKPFFISYTIDDTKAVSISASLGALLYSNQLPVRNKSVRVLVGNYDFNDESLDVSYYNDLSAMSEINIPIEDDYFGIRRALWVTTDGIYKSAAKIYKENKQYLTEKDITLEKLPHRRFVKAPVVNLSIDKQHEIPNIESLENLVKEVSAFFNEEPEIHHSMVTLSFINSTKYITNSEGSKIKYPYSIATIQVYAEIKTKDGESIYDQISHFSFEASGLPSKAALEKDVLNMISGLKEMKTTKVFKDSYLGPVLFVEEAVGSVLSTSLFGFEGLVTSNDISTRDNYSYNGQYLDDKIGNKILSNGMSVQSMPKLKYFDGQPLPGSFEVDAEGVIPQDTLTLVEDGFLLSLLNSRTATADNHALNGHSSEQSLDPGVIKVSFDKPTSISTLKEKLIESAKEDGLQYALMIKRIPYGNYMAANVYKVYVEDGREELFRLAQVNPLDIKSLRRIEGSSNKFTVFNNQSNGGLSSFIVPDGLLVDEVEVEGSSAPFLGNKILVENPIADKE